MSTKKTDEKSIERSAAPDLDTGTQTRVVESIVLRGDLSGLSPKDRARYYVAQCEQLGLNPNAQPFAFLRLNGKEILYATRGCTDQLAAIHRITREIIDGPKVIDLAGTKLVICVAKAIHPNGRTETSTATVPLADPMNVLMKAETKAKRRVTLSILGLALLDEMELETIPAANQEPGGGVDFSHLASSDAEDPVAAEVVQEKPAVPAALAEFYARVAEVELPGEGVTLWMKHRAELAPLSGVDREAAWRDLCRKVEEVGRMKNAKVWLKKAIAEEDARRRSGGSDPQAALEGAGDPRAVERQGVLGAIEGARDVADLVQQLVAALAAYPAMSDALWTSGIGTGLRLGADEATVRRMVDERINPPDGPGPGNGGGRAPTKKTAAKGSASDAEAAQGEVMTVGEGILARHGNNLFAIPGSVAKHADELTAEDCERIAAHVAFRTTSPKDEAARRRLLDKARRDVASWIEKGRTQAQARVAS